MKETVKTYKGYEIHPLIYLLPRRARRHRRARAMPATWRPCASAGPRARGRGSKGRQPRVCVTQPGAFENGGQARRCLHATRREAD